LVLRVQLARQARLVWDQQAQLVRLALLALQQEQQV
jgi:hypothetical protein